MKNHLVKGTKVVGVGHYLPARVVTNDDLSRTLDTNDTWIRTRTGIGARHIAAEKELTSDLAVKAAQNALKNAGLQPNTIDLVILATTTADHIFPATAARIQAALGTTGAAFDMAAVCSGFVFALATADAYVKAGLASRVLVIGAETMSRLLDWNDRNTAVLFGDGAGAFVLTGTHTCPRESDQAGFWGHALHTDGRAYDMLFVDGGVGCGRLGTMQMNGREVFKRAVRELAGVSQEVLQANNVPAEAIDWVVPHQANKRIIMAVLDRLRLSQEKAVLTMEHHANTSAASVPLAFATGVEKGLIQPGHMILTQAFAAGFAWGANVWRF